MSDYGSNYVTSERNRRWLPSKPWNRQPLSPTIPVAKLRLYKDLALRVLSKSLTELPSQYYYRHLALSNNSSSALSSSSRAPSSISAYRPSSVVSYSSSAPMDQVTLSYPGTPTKSYGYIQQQQHLATLASSYGRPSSVNLHTHPSSRYSPDPYLQYTIGSGSGTWSLGSHRQSSSHSDRHYPISPSTIARRNVTLPVTHNSSSSLTNRSSALPGITVSHRSPEPYGATTTTSNTGESSLREQIKNGLKYFADERKRLRQYQQQQQQHYNDNLYHSDHDLRYIQTNLSSPYNLNSGGVYGQGSMLTPSVPTQSILRSQGMIAGAYPRTRQHRSESDLDALFNLYSHVPDPVIERRPLPGVSRVGGIPYTDTSLQIASNPYLQRNASFPSIPLPGSMVYNNTYGSPYSGQIESHVHQPQASYYNQHHLHPSYQQQHLQSIEQQRYAQSNPYTIHPGYGSATHNRYSRSLDRYYN
ncbi:uncharacterized protein LOC128393082 isoform X1 [Panonychus citri]|uniref:uncharacterized protein LOC128393082 isoform X1 n=1 Tax=Panonychus citri TaxID=50023 RepID=UPI0023080946|nr:uncharacterized protein LOC128393082 isoform X1 [Panonychus citri]